LGLGPQATAGGQGWLAFIASQGAPAPPIWAFRPP
jgi:hypothetical protein